MNPPASLLLPLIFAVLAAAPALRAASFLEWIFPKRDVQVIAVTDTTPAGLLRRAATPANPIYYQAVSAGYRDFGGIIAGEKIPPKEEVMQTIAKVLAKQGYLAGSAEHPPTVILIWTWGTMNTDMMYSGDADDPGRQINRNQLLRFMGAYKLGLITKEPDAFRNDLLLPGALFRDAETETVADLATEDLYVAAISAYDYAAATRSEKVLLWTTKISCPSRGLALPQTLPAMLALAGPHIGRETAKPVQLKATEQFKTEVKIGEATVVDYVEKDSVPVIEVTPTAPTKKQKAAPKK
ncbi:MAG: hypothetical protein Q8N18_08230 [Opitutaceae bacterium]|nr:hypothetical protein [Opitutaceae bacterium]